MLDYREWTRSGLVEPKGAARARRRAAAKAVLASLRDRRGHSFLNDNVSITDSDVPVVHGHRQVIDAHLLTLVRRHNSRLLTFDRQLAALGGRDVDLLTI